MLKQYSSRLIVNDLESYAYYQNVAFLQNKSDFDRDLYRQKLTELNKILASEDYYEGIITKHYAPKDTNDIQPGERAFYTRENALRIDTIRYFIDTVENYHIADTLLAMLLIEASVHANTSGVFKGFYKDKETGIGKFGGTKEDALSRILEPITIKEPILSEYECPIEVWTHNAAQVAKVVDKVIGEADITYIDPPYNQHPYGSNYFMLNLIADYEEPEVISKVSGIPTEWNRSPFNNKKEVEKAFKELLSSINSKYILLSYNNEGFLSRDELLWLINDNYGIHCGTKVIPYNTFRGSRNLKNRSMYTDEYIICARKW